MIIHKQLKYCCLCDFCMHMLFMLVYVFIFGQKIFRAHVKMLFQCRIKKKLSYLILSYLFLSKFHTFFSFLYPIHLQQNNICLHYDIKSSTHTMLWLVKINVKSCKSLYDWTKQSGYKKSTKNLLFFFALSVSCLIFFFLHRKLDNKEFWS